MGVTIQFNIVTPLVGGRTEATPLLDSHNGRDDSQVGRTQHPVSVGQGTATITSCFQYTYGRVSVIVIKPFCVYTNIHGTFMPKSLNFSSYKQITTCNINFLLMEFKRYPVHHAGYLFWLQMTHHNIH